MRWRWWPLGVLAAALGLPALCSDAWATSRPRTNVVRVTGPVLIAFAPPAASEAAGGPAAVLGPAIDETLKCLSPLQPRVRFVKATTISLDNREHTERIAVRHVGQGVGVILVEPGRAARVVYPAQGSQDLGRLLPQAAFEYWGAQGCRP